MSENSSVKQYFKDCFEKKRLIRKGIIAAIALALVLIFSLSFYFWLKDKTGVVGQENGFWFIEITWNDGVGFSGLRGNLPAIFTIQTLMFLLLLAIFLFLCQDNITSSFAACAMFGGLFNLLQRAATPTKGVLDYFRFGFWKSFPTFNWPDMFVVVGIFGFVISYIVLMVLEYQKDKKAEQKKPQEPKPEQPVA